MVNEIKNTRFIVLIFVFIALSCSQSTDKDYSLSPEEYRELGIPDYSTTWDFMDYQEACIALNNIKATQPLALPRIKSERSGKIFKRIINPDNLSFLYTDTMSLNEKALHIQKYVDIQGCFVTVYTNIDNNEQFYNRELIDLYIFGLTIAQSMLDLGNLINESVEEKDLEMQYGFRSIQNLYITMVLFVMENQQKSHFFETDDLERLSDFLANSVLINKDWMEKEAAEHIKQQAEKIVENTSSEKIKTKYASLIAEL